MAEESQSRPIAEGMSQDTVEAQPQMLASAGKEHSHPSQDGPIDGAESNESKRARRGTIRVACNACRTKKVRCDGRRPTCGKCAQQARTQCVYDTERTDETRAGALRRENDLLRRDLEHTNRVIQELISLPKDESVALLDRIRNMRHGPHDPPAGNSNPATFSSAGPARNPGVTGGSRNLPFIEAVRSEADGVTQSRIVPSTSVHAAPDSVSSYDVRTARPTSQASYGNPGMRYA